MSTVLFRVLRSASRALLAQGALHAELFALEFSEERLRLWRMLVSLLTGALFAFCSLLSLSAAIIIVSWGTPYQNTALFGLVLFFIAGTVTSLLRFRSLALRGRKAFSGTIAEVREDLALIRERLGD